ncbi:MAG: FAD-dependent oxidoreductase [Pseudomonadota bacterium]
MMMTKHTHIPDLIVVGGGTAGLPAAICAAERGLEVVLVEKSDTLGGTLRYAKELSAAGTKQQRDKAIEDHPAWHKSEVLNLGKGLAHERLVDKATRAAAQTLAWLEGQGVEIDPVCPQIVYNHEAYKIARTHWAVGSGAAIADILVSKVEALETSGRCQVLRGTALASLQIDGARVKSITLTDGQVLKAHHILLATGGYAASQALYQRFHSMPQIMAWAPVFAQGEGLVAGEAAGLDVTGHDGFNLSFGGVMDGGGPARNILCRLNTLPQLRQPWEIIVNTRGERFLREDEPSIDAQEEALLAQPGYAGFMVFDDRIRQEAPDRMRKWYLPPHEEDFDGLEWFYEGETLEALAQAAGIDPQGLAKTVTAYNAAQSSGADPLGRSHMPMPITKPPFFAIRFQGCNVISPVGLKANAELQAVTQTGTTIENLYLAGEILGSCQLMGRSAAGGMMATPAMSFGRLIGQSIEATPALKAAV